MPLDRSSQADSGRTDGLTRDSWSAAKEDDEEEEDEEGDEEEDEEDEDEEAESSGAKDGTDMSPTGALSSEAWRRYAADVEKARSHADGKAKAAEAREQKALQKLSGMQAELKAEKVRRALPIPSDSL